MGFCMTLVCEKCGRRSPYFRSTDPSIPEWVDTLSQSHCGLPGCDTGDRLIETWLDADGVARDPENPAFSGAQRSELTRSAQDAPSSNPTLQGKGQSDV